ncbi:hypothetical protein HDU97_005178 [Phlyctochytrium planicorne]|nr:hypothetical protein HDU97_005178 [Phlyctochytrium planicorne]
MQLLASLLLFSAAAVVNAQDAAIAVLLPTVNSTIQGIVRFQEVLDPATSAPLVRIMATLNGMEPASVHGFHIHAFGDTSSPKGDNTFGHFNPFKRNHTCDATTGHAGDFGSITADEGGNVYMTWETSALSFNGSLPNFLIGRGVMVHANPDDCVTMPTGNAGGRLSQGAIGWLPSSAPAPAGPSPAPATSAAPAPAATTQAAPVPTTPSAETPVAVKKGSRVRRATAAGSIDAIAVFSSIAGSNVTGAVYFHQNEPTSPVSVAFNVSGLSPATSFGIRVLNVADISNPPSLDKTAFFGPVDPCSANVTGLNGSLVSDASGRISIPPQSSQMFTVNGWTLYPDSTSSILGHGLAIFLGGSDCNSQSTAISAYLGQGVIALRNGTVAPSFSATLPITQTVIKTTEATGKSNGAASSKVWSIAAFSGIVGSFLLA